MARQDDSRKAQEMARQDRSRETTHEQHMRALYARCPYLAAYGRTLSTGFARRLCVAMHLAEHGSKAGSTITLTDRLDALDCGTRDEEDVLDIISREHPEHVSQFWLRDKRL